MTAQHGQLVLVEPLPRPNPDLERQAEGAVATARRRVTRRFGAGDLEWHGPELRLVAPDGTVLRTANPVLGPPPGALDVVGWRLREARAWMSLLGPVQGQCAACLTAIASARVEDLCDPCRTREIRLWTREGLAHLLPSWVLR